MIGISAPSYDPAGHLVLPVRAAGAYQARRRGSVTQTLDGGVSVYDGGYSDGDTTVAASWSGATPAQLATLRYLIAFYAELYVCIESGVFAARAEFAHRGNVATLSLRLLRRLDA